MTPRKLAGFLKSHWPLAVIAVAVAVLAFAAGALASNRGAADERTPAAATSNPAGAPTPTVPPELYYTPTNEEFTESLRALERKRAASGNDDKKDGLGSKYTPRSPVPRSTAQARAWAAPEGRALYFVAGDKVIFLPEGVERSRWITSISCYGDLPVCPEAPVTILKKGEATVSLDAYGDVVPGLFDTDDPDAFPFLREHDE